MPPATTEGAPVAGTSAPERAATAPAQSTGAPAAAPRLAVVDVLAPAPDGPVLVAIDGAEYTARAATAEPLASGGRYVLQVERGAAGVVLKSPPPNAPGLATEVATALLRVPAPDLGSTVTPLRAELAALTQPQTAAPVRAAAVAVRYTLDSIVPGVARPPDATELQRLVENGGRHFEAKLARLVETAEASDAPAAAKPTTDAPEVPDAPTPAAAKDGATQAREPHSRASTEAVRADVGSDLKGDLLRLLQAVSELGGAARAPVAEAALHGIESQQAGQVLAQAAGTPYYLQVPFPDGGVWRTLSLALELQSRPDQPDAERAGRFRVFMHVPLTELGETWIEAGLAADQLRATIYLDRATSRDRVRADIGDLRAELEAEGYTEVLLDVRAASDLPARHRREAGALAAGRPATVSVLDVKV
ncbi:MAG: hypothetical protein FJ304_02530 [Planctomycetes bacterium]|nr:hypothetical protein [Planctomycetota bacterium]